MLANILCNFSSLCWVRPILQRKREYPDFVNEHTAETQQRLGHDFGKMLGVLSLTERPSHQLMWSHYAQNHEGFVVGFDSTHEYFDQRKTPMDALRYLRKVEYQRNRPRGILGEMDVKAVFLVKDDVWDYEQEWRIIREINDANRLMNPNDPYPIGLFTYPSNAITKIILGARMDEGHRQEIVDLLKDSVNLSHVRLFRAEASQKEFAIDIQEITL